MLRSDSRWRQRAALWGTLVLLAAALCAAGSLAAQAQNNSGAASEGGPSSSVVEPPSADSGAADGQPQTPKPDEGVTLYMLIVKGGPLMIPLYLMLIIVVAFAIERTLALRRSKVMPDELIEGLGQLSTSPGGFDPRKAYRLCQQYPSAASNVIRAMLLKVGRPHSEVEHTVAEASDREATRLYGKVGWLTLCAAVAPLWGLFGTVWGMIVTFHQMTVMDPAANRATALSEEIYVALVTTLGGLFVAIPAAMLAHYFEVRIVNVFHQIDELLFSLMPQVERYEGRLRVSRQSLGSEEVSEPPVETAKQPATAPK